MNQEQWRDLFLSDIQSLESPVILRRWAASWAEEITTQCPESVEEIRAAYLKRLAELQKACME